MALAMPDDDDDEQLLAELAAALTFDDDCSSPKPASEPVLEFSAGALVASGDADGDGDSVGDAELLGAVWSPRRRLGIELDSVDCSNELPPLLLLLPPLPPESRALMAGLWIEGGLKINDESSSMRSSRPDDDDADAVDDADAAVALERVGVVTGVRLLGATSAPSSWPSGVSSSWSSPSTSPVAVLIATSLK